MMPRGDCTFRQRDATALLKAARDAGLDVARVTVDRDGKIVIETPKAPAGDGEPDITAQRREENPWHAQLDIRDIPKAT